MPERDYEKRVNDVDELRLSLLSVWHSIGQNVIDEAISVACATRRLCTSKRGSFWAPDVKLTWTEC